jgi:hypothetical protein
VYTTFLSAFYCSRLSNWSLHDSIQPQQFTYIVLSVQSVHLKENDLIKNDEYILYSNKSVKTQISFNTVYSTVLY